MSDQPREAQERAEFERAHKAAGYGAVRWNPDRTRPIHDRDAARYVGWQLARSTPPVDEAASRAEFEALMLRRFYPQYEKLARWMAGTPNAGDYVLSDVHVAWEAWQAARSLPRVKRKGLTEEDIRAMCEEVLGITWAAAAAELCVVTQRTLAERWGVEIEGGEHG